MNAWAFAARSVNRSTSARSGQVDLHRVRVALRQLEQHPQLGGDVGERHGLQGPAPAERLVVDLQRLLGGLALAGELVEEPRPVEVLDGGDPAGVGVRPEVAPSLQGDQGGRDLVQVDDGARAPPGRPRAAGAR